MNQKKLIGLSITLVALLVLGFTVRRAVYYAPNAEVTPPALVAASTSSTSSAAVSSSEKPNRLKIPSLGIDAAVQYVGIKANGAMANPSNFQDVGWYDLGTIPGQVGSAVIAGHVDNALALAGVFKHLADINVGDAVYIVKNDGTTLHFVVTDIAEYPYKDAPSEKIFATGGGKYLNIITCAGIWVKSDKSYDQRLVVYTKLVE